MTSNYSPIVLPELSVLAAEQRDARLRTLKADEEARETARQALEERERTAAERGAQEMVETVFPGTLARVVSLEMWRGYPSLTRTFVNAVPPSAVAYLGGNTYLHYAELESGDWVMTLHQPCTACGARVEHRLWDDIELGACLASDDNPQLCGARSCERRSAA
ncbi:hypothetical protein [Streptomyces natalensis]|uniref:Uncharacterized protein n=1 Tax=Streptomyces natalensis ATCC 27448 TaxID=1240678 RepID=A0A0D7CRG4_9ACTN|nr:hypothetical protein [Streptomyces natalensis]KIZ18651.1 hypothetical protein SNA_08640 [Streptomyces natalensis ATCC 27448]